jgi:hypothetical protein
MPILARNKSHQQRGASGMFTSNSSPLNTSESKSDDVGDTLWETDTESEMDNSPLNTSESKSDDVGDTLWETDTESEMDNSYFEAWETLPVPQTYEEREQRNAKKKEKAAAKHRVTEMRSAEHREAGPTDQKGALSVWNCEGDNNISS